MRTDSYTSVRALWPNPPANPTDALLHTVDMFADQPDDEMAVIATSNVYGPGVRTGLTWGDLRKLAAILNAQR